MGECVCIHVFGCVSVCVNVCHLQAKRGKRNGWTTNAILLQSPKATTKGRVREMSATCGQSEEKEMAEQLRGGRGGQTFLWSKRGRRNGWTWRNVLSRTFYSRGQTFLLSNSNCVKWIFIILTEFIECVCLPVTVCVCVCACVCEHVSLHVCVWVSACVYIHVFGCVCVCVNVRHLQAKRGKRNGRTWRNVLSRTFYSRGQTFL